ncbi:DUF262 domain-containing protein [Methylobacterium bullatum]|uniref:DUF262 domain-containing protein n=1 Tax=Methylobacterium bullatum TaxID=570505 RepID=A0A679JXV2_9HYPH|nr:hypothetical protein MBLL_00367 [Methylobacterium bullatum]
MSEDERKKRTIEPVHQSVSKLLGAPQTFRAPRYQRNYAWDDNEISAFLGDLDICVQRRIGGQNGRHHFFGGLVTVNAPVAGSTRVNLEVVDGQQRLATFAMLISRLRNGLTFLSGRLPASDPLKDVLAQRASTLRTSYEIYQDEIRLENVNVHRVQLSVPDQPFFVNLLEGVAVNPDRKSHRLLKNAFDRIDLYIMDLIQSAGDETKGAESLQAVHDVLRADWTIIHMAATEKSDAYMLFQVLNDRGVSLTEGELLRSSTLEALEQTAGIAQIDEVEALWNEMLGGETHMIRNAFGWLYAAQLGDWPSRATMLEDYLAAFFPVIPRDGVIDPKASADLIAQVRNLAADFKSVQHLLLGDWPLAFSNDVTAWEKNRLRLLTRHLHYTDCISLLVAACALKPRKFVEIVLLLERFAFRYAVIGEAPPERARAVLNKHAVNIRRDPGAYKFNAIRSELGDLIARHVPDDVFKSAIEQLRYSHSPAGNKPVKYLLLTLEDYTAWFDANPQGSPVCRDHMRLLDFETGTIEHIYSQNAEERDVNLDPLVDALGNLTLLSGPENDRCGNRPYIGKRAVLAESTSIMNRRIAENAVWTPGLIESRSQVITNMAMRIFQI